jgi:hypothetical protein
MPTNRRSRNTRRVQLDRTAVFAELEINIRQELLTGTPFFSPGLTTDELRYFWEQFADEIRSAWKEKNPPGTRCFSEWAFEIIPKHGERKVTPEFERRCREELGFRERLTKHGILHTHTWPAFQESDADYLRHNGLLEKGEDAAIAKHTREADRYFEKINRA